MDDIRNPDDNKREDRCIQLIGQVCELELDLCDMKDKLDAAAQEASQAIYQALKKVEPDLPEYKDWTVNTVIADKKIFTDGAITWSFQGAAIVTNMFVAPAIYNTLQPLVESCNCFKVVLARAVSVSSEATIRASEEYKIILETEGPEVYEKMVQEAAETEVEKTVVADSVVMDILEGSGVGLTKTTISTTGKVLAKRAAGGTAVAAAAAVWVALALVAGTIKEIIKDSFKARQQLKYLKLQYEELMEELMGAKKAFEAATTVVGVTKDSTDFRARAGQSDVQALNRDARRGCGHAGATGQARPGAAVPARDETSGRHPGYGPPGAGGPRPEDGRLDQRGRPEVALFRARARERARLKPTRPA